MPLMNNLMMTAAGSGSACPALEGTLWSWGNGDNFIGHGTIGTDRSVPTQIGSDTNWTNNIGKWNQGEGVHIVKSDGSLWGWGYQNFGQVGTGSTSPHISAPVQIGSLTDWAQVTNGGNHTAAVKTDGTLWTWGSNGYGQLGLGDTTTRSSPVQVGSLTDWAAVVSPTAYYMMALKTDGTMWSWGVNREGNLGDNSTTDRSSPVQVGSATNWLAVEPAGNTVGGFVLALASA